MIEATVVHLMRHSEEEGTEVLLGERDKTLFCPGVWNGVGGKFNFRQGRWEKKDECAKRETREESSVKVRRKDLTHYATVDFYYPEPDGTHVCKWRVHFFVTRKWKGQPRPRAKRAFSQFRWFSLNRLPFEKMMPGQIWWVHAALVDALKGRVWIGHIFFADSEGTEVCKHHFDTVSSGGVSLGGVTAVHAGTSNGAASVGTSNGHAPGINGQNGQGAGQHDVVRSTGEVSEVRATT